jgi:hypothetical protein
VSRRIRTSSPARRTRPCRCLDRANGTSRRLRRPGRPHGRP